MNEKATPASAAPRDYFLRPRFALANIELDDLSFEEIIEYSNIVINEKKANLFIVTLDILGAYNSIFDERYSSIVSGAEIITCDGAGLKMLSKIKGGRAVKNKVSGVDLSARLLTEAAARGYKAAFIGARPEVISKLETAVLSGYKGIGETFFHHGYFTPAQRVSIIEKLSRFKPDIALIAGKPGAGKIHRRDQTVRERLRYDGRGRDVRRIIRRVEARPGFYAEVIPRMALQAYAAAVENI